MKKQDIISAYIRIREIDQTIPDEILDFMKEAAIERLERASKPVTDDSRRQWWYDQAEQPTNNNQV